MAVSPWLRLWLPLGNVLLIVAIVETIDLIRNEIKEIGIFIYQGLTISSRDFSDFYTLPELIFLSLVIVLQLIATIGLLWIGAILKGNKNSLLVWIVITVLTNVGLTIYFLINAIQVDIHIINAWSIAYTLFVVVVFNSYFVFIAGVCYQALRRQETLHPLGKGVAFIWEYFCNETKVAATFFLTSEIALDTEYMISRQFIQFFGVSLQGHDGDSYPPIIVEEIVLRLIRIVLNAIGIWLVSTERRRVFRWWCAITFFLILVSTSIFIILTVQWRGEDISTTLAYFIMFPGHLLYRFVTLYFCLKYTRADFSRFVL